MTAAAVATPALAAEFGNIAIEQGRQQDGPELMRSVEVIEPDEPDDDVAPPNLPAIEEPPDNLSDSGFFPRAQVKKLSDILDLSTGENAASRAAARRRATLAAQTLPSLVLRPSTEDPFGQNDNGPPSPTAQQVSTPYMSTPSIHITTPSVVPAMPDRLLHSLLRSHYCRSEVAFVLTLETIANRLLVIPKPARVSALRAELTELNHKLPAEVRCVT